MLHVSFANPHPTAGRGDSGASPSLRNTMQLVLAFAGAPVREKKKSFGQLANSLAATRLAHYHCPLRGRTVFA